MSGYGSPDDYAEHAAILAENGISKAQQSSYKGESARTCKTCEEEIPEARRIALPGVFQCVKCRNEYETNLRR